MRVDSFKTCPEVVGAGGCEAVVVMSPHICRITEGWQIPTEFSPIRMMEPYLRCSCRMSCSISPLNMWQARQKSVSDASNKPRNFERGGGSRFGVCNRW